MKKAIFALALAATAVVGKEAPLVVPTPHRSPAEQQKLFRLPEGFEIQLVASEPDIAKPMNMAFDDRGRLWVTDTVEYPFPAPGDRKARDTLKVLEDFDETGRARKVTTFADGLNVPMGVLPHRDGALVFSIPNIYYVADTDNDGKADTREVFLGTFGQRDTHGLTSSFTRTLDGWIHACHGYLNTSTIRGKDGSEITMQSGNTYRFTPDASRVEYFTHGQVNPFGIALDPLGNLFTTDCHTMPITLLLRGGYYQSFGKPDDGLGFVPEVCDKMFGSTAIAGIEAYHADAFPEQYRGAIFIGNVQTNSVNQGILKPRGGGFFTDQQPDFLTCEDQWFRPIQVRLGPDGALYVADFYNKIIGHYEVDLKHPGRDRTSGRIWRIVYKGGASSTPSRFDLSKASTSELIERLADANLTLRMFATHRLVDRVGKPAVEPLKAALERPRNNWQKAHILWALHRLNAMSADTLAAAAADPDAVVRTHVMRILADVPKWESAHRQAAIRGLSDSDGTVARCAADALARHPAEENISALLALRTRGELDPHLLHNVRMALRDHLNDAETAQAILKKEHAPRERPLLADVAVGSPTAAAADFLIGYLAIATDNRETLIRLSQHAARYGTNIDGLTQLTQSKFAKDIDLQLSLFQGVQQGLAQRGQPPTDTLRSWGRELAAGVLSGKQELDPWTSQPLPGSAQADPWVVQTKRSQDQKDAPFFTSLPQGEELTGLLRSKSFRVPERLSFYLSGHNGLPPANHPIKNVVRLREAATGQVLAEAAPPRNDIAQKITWDLKAHAGKEAYFEAVDGDQGAAYAWLAFGRFSPEVIRVPASREEQRRRIAAAAGIVESLRLADLHEPITSLLTNGAADVPSRSAAAKALLAINVPSSMKTLLATLKDASAPDPLREAIATALSQSDSAEARKTFIELMQTAPNRLQRSIAIALASTKAGSEALLTAVAEGKASPRLLQSQSVLSRLKTSGPANLDQRIEQLTRNLPEADLELQKLIDQRSAAFNPSTASAERGQAVYTQNCAVCHQLAGQGAKVGPQLDGVGKRGVARLAEDILDSNRNVDIAFRSTTFVLDKSDPIDGIVRAEQGESFIVVDSQGKEHIVPKAKIKKRIDSKLSLMPSNFHELIKPQEFDDLMAFLMSK